MIKTRIAVRLLTAPDGLWFHPDDPHLAPFQILGKDGRPLSPEDEKQYYTGRNTAEHAERVLAGPTPEEEQRLADFLEDRDLEELATHPEYNELSPDDGLVVRGVALLVVRGAIEASRWTDIYPLMTEPENDWVEVLVREPEERIAVDVLCERMDLSTQDPMSRAMALAYWVGVFNDYQWELVAHLLRKVKGSVTEVGPRP